MKQTLENAQTTSTFSSVDPFQLIFPQNYLLAGKLLCLSLIHCSFWRVWASVQARGRGLNRFFFLFFFWKFLCTWFLPATFSWALGRLILVLYIMSTIVNFISFFRLPRVISCSGLLSYFQRNYFQDSHSHIFSEKLHSWPWVCSVSGLNRVHFHSYSFTLEKRNKGDTVWAPL